ncbi:MAG: response regulator [Desulfovibrio sp.]
MHKILFVDDEIHLSQVHAKRMEHRGYTVYTAGSAAEAFAIADEHPDLAVAVLDVRMPGMDGIELTSKLKGAHPDLAVVILTGYGSPLCRLETARWGAQAFLTKPVEIDELIGTIERVAQQRAERLELRARRLAV